MELYLCEKPSQARDIAKVLGAGQRQDGCLAGGDVVVTWAFGHLLEMSYPEHYDKALKKWSKASLPITPGQWHMSVKPSAKKQHKIVSTLLRSATHVVIATDADREGEVIARELMEQAGYSGPVERLWLSALDDASIRRALSDKRPGDATEALYAAGLGRARADWLFGINLTRLFTLLASDAGHEGVMSVGRVQTPTLAMVVNRDQRVEAFVAVPYWDISLHCVTDGQPFIAAWNAAGETAIEGVDSDGHCIEPSLAKHVFERLSSEQQAQVLESEVERKSQRAPLPFSLSTLQSICDKRLGLGAQQVLDIAQSLYETHKATTYPRTDCNYLPESQFAEVQDVLTNLAASDSEMATLVETAQKRLPSSSRSRCWNDKKITAHHAIIPTAARIDLDAMSSDEQAVYDLIRRYYLAQFLPNYEYDLSTARLSCIDQLFDAKGLVTVVAGWRDAIMGRGNPSKEEGGQVLPRLVCDQMVGIEQAELLDKKTKPPSRYTEGTLVSAMKNVARDIEDPQLKMALKDAAGIGTEATRAGIINTLLDRNLLQKKKRQLVSTDTGRALIAVVPAVIKDPTTTALWEMKLDQIAEGRASLDEFMGHQKTWLTKLVQTQLGESAVTMAQVSAHPCPECGSALRRIKGSKGFFWGCSGYPDCKTTLPDTRGKPGKPKTKRQATKNKQAVKQGDNCPECKAGNVILRAIQSGQNQGKSFLGCSGHPKCKFFQWAK